MDKYRHRNPQSTETELPSLAVGEWQRVNEAVIDLNNGPAAILLARQELGILVPKRDLGGDWEDDCLVVDPKSFNPKTGEGYISLPDGQVIVLGRSSDFGKFDFLPQVSRQHIELARAGSQVSVRDLGSTNGTYLAYRPESTATDSGKDWPTWPGHSYERIGDSIHMAGYSIASEGHPSRNEDNYFIDEDGRAAGVFDGIGGMVGSEKAAEMASQMMRHRLGSLPPLMTEVEAREAVLRSMHDTHEAIVKGSRHAIGTTATVAKVFENGSGGRFAVIASAGDSRAYAFRDGKLQYLTIDHGYRGFDMSADENRELQEKLGDVTRLSDLDSRGKHAFMNRNIISSSLGVSGSTPDITVGTMPVSKGDMLLLTTDGITDNLTYREMERIIADRTDIDGICRGLVESSRHRSRDTAHLRSKPDDMTAVILTI